MATLFWTPPAIGGTISIYNPPATPSSIIRQDLTSNTTIESISSGGKRKNITILNISSLYTLTLKNQFSGVPVLTQMILPSLTDMTVPTYGIVTLFYDDASNAWLVQSTSSGAGGGGGGFVPTSTQVIAGIGLSGGGALTGSVTLNIANTAVTAGSYTNTAITVNAQGQITSASSGAGFVPTSTQVIAGTGLSGGGALTGNVTLNIANTAVTAGSYTFANITVNAEGQITSASSGSAVSTSTQVIAGTGLSGGGALTSNVTLAIANTAVTAGSYTSTNLTVNAQGQITAASNGSGGGSGSISSTFNACPTSSVNFTTQGVYDWYVTDGSVQNPPITGTSGHWKALGGYIFRTFAWRTDGTSGISAQNFTSTGFSIATTAPDDIQNNTSLSGVISSVIVFTSSSTLLNWGYKFAVPADTQVRYLRIYGEQFSCDIQGYFRLTDGSHADVTVTKTGTAGVGTQHMLECIYNSVVGGWLDVVISVTANHGSSPNVKLAGMTLSNS